MNLIQRAFLNTGKPLSTYQADNTYLTLDVMNRATQLFEAAQKSVVKDAVLSKRVRRARLAFDHAWIWRYFTLKREAKNTSKEFLGTSDIKAFTEDFITTAQSFGVEHYREGWSFADYVPQLRARVTLRSPAAPSVPLPAELLFKMPPNNAARDVVDLQQDEFRLSKEAHWVELADDTQASDGKAARMSGNHTQWAVQYPLAVDAEGVWRHYALARIKTKAGAPHTGKALDYGIFDAEKNAPVATLSKPLTELVDEQYHLLDLGAHALSSDSYLWIAPTNNPNVEAVYVDRIILLREPKARQP